MREIFVAGVKVTVIAHGAALEKVRGWFGHDGQYMIFTPNPEMAVKAERDEYFKAVLNSGDLNLCDGRGLQLAARGRMERIPGADFMLDICHLAEEQGKSIFLLGSGNEEVAARAAAKLKELFPRLQIAGSDAGPEVREEEGRVGGRLRIAPEAQQLALGKINAARPDILFVAFGMGKQEKWIRENLAKLPSVKIAMGVGGTFDYLAGRLRRAPLLLRRLGLEWLYRLWQQPQRAGRIFTATILFLYYYVRNRNRA